MSAGFTPGPWEPVFGKVHPSVRGLRWVEVTPPADFPLVRDYLVEANARLIAAAPELYEALEITRRHLALFCSDTDEIAATVFRLADSAIAKARGDNAIAAAPGTAETEQPAQCEASQSGLAEASPDLGTPPSTVEQIL